MTLSLLKTCAILITLLNLSDQQNLPKTENRANKIDINKYAYHVQIVKESDNCSHVFFGSLVHVRWVLTSCAVINSNGFLEEIKTKRVNVIGGSKKLCDSDAQIRKVSW